MRRPRRASLGGLRPPSGRLAVAAGVRVEGPGGAAVGPAASCPPAARRWSPFRSPRRGGRGARSRPKARGPGGSTSTPRRAGRAHACPAAATARSIGPRRDPGAPSSTGALWRCGDSRAEPCGLTRSRRLRRQRPGRAARRPIGRPCEGMMAAPGAASALAGSIRPEGSDGTLSCEPCVVLDSPSALCRPVTGRDTRRGEAVEDGGVAAKHGGHATGDRAAGVPDGAAGHGRGSTDRG